MEQGMKKAGRYSMNDPKTLRLTQTVTASG